MNSLDRFRVAPANGGSLGWPFAVAGALMMALSAGPAAASQVDSWGGQAFLRHPTDAFAYPHRALEFPNSATLIYVPPTSTAGDFARAPSDNQDVAGVLTFGKGRWSGIIGANYPNAFNPLEAYGTGSSRGWGKSLKDGDINHEHLVLGIDSSFSPQPTPKMQIGGAFEATDQVRVGGAFQQFGQEWTDDTILGMNPAEKTGFDISGYSITGSASVLDIWRFQQLEYALSYGTSDQKEFSPIDGEGGSGDANAFSVNGIATLGDLDWIGTNSDLNYNLYVRYDRTTSGFTDAAVDSVPEPPPAIDNECNNIDIRAGLSHQNTGAFATSFGYKRMRDEETSTSPSGRFHWLQTTVLFPCCDAAGEVEIGKGFAIDYGMMVFWENRETEQTFTDPNGDLISNSTEKDENVGTSYHAGVVWRPTDRFRLSMTLDTDQLGDPGGAVFGNSNDAPGIALGAWYRFD